MNSMPGCGAAKSPFTSIASLPIAERISPARICRSILRCCRRHGTRGPSRKSSPTTKPHSRQGRGRTGCWAITTVPGVRSRGGPAQARVAAMLLLTLRGTPTLYYGDEIGMHQVAIAPDQVRDPFEKNVPGIGVGRDGCRTPMQWDATPYAGFSATQPWLPLADDFPHENVVNLEADSRSILSLYKALIGLRTKLSHLQSG